MKRLLAIATALKAPKGEFNDFGKYSYRTLANINEALKPLLLAQQCALVLSDEIVMLGDRYYVKATATLFGADGKTIAQATSFAREALVKKGMDESQITGTASSYARKYAIGALFMIDDTKDADALNNNAAYTEPAPAALPDYPADKFNTNKAIWLQSINAGRVSAGDVIKKLQTQFTLNKSQLNEIKAMGSK